MDNILSSCIIAERNKFVQYKVNVKKRPFERYLQESGDTITVSKEQWNEKQRII
jgi:hypothetical protein